MFDPYDQWLGIPAGRRPITYYHLLGIDPGEADPASVEKAARRQLARLGKFREGPHSEACSRLTREIRQACDALRAPAKRRKYDALLARRSPADQPLDVTEEFLDEDEPAAEDEAPGAAEAPRKRPGKPAGRRGKKRRPEPSGNGWIWAAVGGGAALLLLAGGLAYWLTRTPKAEPKNEPVAEAPRPRQPEPAPAPPTKAPAPAPIPVVAAKPPAPPPAPPAPPAPKARVKPKFPKMKVPPDDALAKAEKVLREKFKDDYAKDKPEDRLALAARFLQPGREDRNDPAAWYVLLREARDLAVQAGRPRLAVEAVDEIDKYFLIDPVAQKLQALTRVGEDPSEAAARLLAPVALGQVDTAIAAEDLGSAQKLFALAEAARTKAYPSKSAPGAVAAQQPPAGKKNSPEKEKTPTAAAEQAAAAARLADRLNVAKGRLADARKDLDELAAARAKLKAEAGDAVANRTVGRHLCLVQGKWEEGLPLLAKGDDPLLKRLAALEAAPPPDNFKGLVEAADGWWAVGRRLSGRPKEIAWERAALWYDRAEAKAAPGEKLHVSDQRRDHDEAVLSDRGTRLMPGSFYGRGAEDRILLLREGGGTMKTEEAVARGLEWLADHQDRSGKWSLDGFAAAGKCNCGDAGALHDVAGTAFALLPFLGAGETHRHGPHSKAVNKGLKFLLGEQAKRKDGRFSDNAYEHALATIAVCELYGITRESGLAAPAQLAVRSITGVQNPDGGWGYGAGQPADTSVTGWQFSALKAGAFARLNVPSSEFAKVAGYLERVASSDGLGFGYNSRSPAPATSATGLLCEQFLGWTPRDERLVKGVRHLSRPDAYVTREKPNLYFLFYATQVMHHFGGPEWEDWNERTRDLLVELQDQGTKVGNPHQKGSWAPLGEDANIAQQGGRLMYTSLALLSLEVYYYSVPLYNFGPSVLQD